MLLYSTSTEVTSKDFEDIVSLIKSDGPSIGASRELDMGDDEVCGVHDGDKTGCAGIGRLTRSKNKVVINAFADCQKFISKFHEVRKNFSKSSKSTMRIDETKKKHADDVPRKNVTIDLNATHIATVRILINDCLRTKKGLQHCALYFEINASHWPTVEDWKQAREVKGVLDLVRHLATATQCKKYRMSECGPVFNLNSCDKLRALTINLLCLSLRD